MESSPLIQLPGEIRNRIYELALYSGQNGLTVRILTGKPQLADDPSNANVLALATTCKQLHRECSPIFYEINKFTLVARPLGQRYDGEIWQKGLRVWLNQIGERNRALLSDVEFDIGTSFMYDLYPTSESVWRSVSALVSLFKKDSTRVSMRTEVNWMSRSRKAFAVSIPLNDTDSAKKVVREVLVEQRLDLDVWCRATHVSIRDSGYRRVELETCGQELRNFISLLETGNGAEFKLQPSIRCESSR